MLYSHRFLNLEFENMTEGKINDNKDRRRERGWEGVFVKSR